MNNFFQKVRLNLTVGLILLSICSSTWAAKINAAYINTQPVPLGNLKLSTATTYGSTAFTRFNIMGLTFCQKGSNGSCSNAAEAANPIYWGGTQVLDANWNVPNSNQPALTILKALNPNGNKKLFASIIGSQSNNYLAQLSTNKITADASTCGSGGSGVNNIHCLLFYLDKFMNVYGINGIDIDLETGNQQGFVNLLAAIGSNSAFSSTYALSFAPFADGNYKSAVYVQGGACVFQDNGLNYIAGRQYYSGGAIGYPPTSTEILVDTLKSEFASAKNTQCTNSTLRLDASSMVMGLAPYSVLGDEFPHGRGFPNTCQYYYQRNNPDCASMMKKVIAKYPNIGGAFVWTSGLIDPIYYACYMGNALNNTSNNCGEPQPIAGNAGFCGPTQAANCQNPNAQDYQAGPIWNNQAAQIKCPTVCSNVGLKWNGQWTTTNPGIMSVCGCIPAN